MAYDAMIVKEVMKKSNTALNKENKKQRQLGAKAKNALIVYTSHNITFVYYRSVQLPGPRSK